MLNTRFKNRKFKAANDNTNYEKKGMKLNKSLGVHGIPSIFLAEMVDWIENLLLHRRQSVGGRFYFGLVTSSKWGISNVCSMTDVVFGIHQRNG